MSKVVIMGAKRIEEIRQRAEAATEGPWEYVSQTEDEYEMPKFVSPEHTIMDFGDCTMFYPTEGTPPDNADAEFLAHAREDIPALLAEVYRLRGIVDALPYMVRGDIDTALKITEDAKSNLRKLNGGDMR